MDDTKCMVSLAKFYLQFTVSESCGKCNPCRIGTKRMLEILERITEGNGTEEDLEKLEVLANTIKKTSVCGLGQTAPNPVLSTLHFFKDEYLAHVKEQKCPARECKALLGFEINQEKCKRCSLCQRNCPVGAILGDRETGFKIDPDKCIKCGACAANCHFGAI